MRIGVVDGPERACVVAESGEHGVRGGVLLLHVLGGTGTVVNNVDLEIPLLLPALLVHHIGCRHARGRSRGGRGILALIAVVAVGAVTRRIPQGVGHEDVIGVDREPVRVLAQAHTTGQPLQLTVAKYLEVLLVLVGGVGVEQFLTRAVVEDATEHTLGRGAGHGGRDKRGDRDAGRVRRRGQVAVRLGNRGVDVVELDRALEVPVAVALGGGRHRPGLAVHGPGVDRRIHAVLGAGPHVGADLAHPELRLVVMQSVELD